MFPRSAETAVWSSSKYLAFYLAQLAPREVQRPKRYVGDVCEPAGEVQVMRWCFAALNTVEPPMLDLMVLDWTADGSCGKHREFLVGWVNRVLTNLERWLANREFVAINEFTVADILMTHVLSGGLKDKRLISPYPKVVAYRDRCLARPAWKRTLEAYYARVEAA